MVLDKWKKLFPTDQEKTDALDYQIAVYLYENPESTRKHLALKFKVSGVIVSKAVLKYKLAFLGSSLPVEQANERLTLYHEGCTVYRIAKVQGVDTRSVDRWLKKHLGKKYVRRARSYRDPEGSRDK